MWVCVHVGVCMGVCVHECVWVYVHVCVCVCEGCKEGKYRRLLYRSPSGGGPLQ